VILFPNRFFLQPLDLIQMIWPVFRHHLRIVGNGDPVIQYRMACGFLQVFHLQSPQQPGATILDIQILRPIVLINQSPDLCRRASAALDRRTTFLGIVEMVFQFVFGHERLTW
jgi:hypothetical protein